MRTQLGKIALAAGFSLALAFTYGCSGDDSGGDNPVSSSSSGGSGSISSAAVSLSSSVQSSSSSLIPSSSSLPSSSSSVAAQPGSSSSLPSSSSSLQSSSSLLPSSSSLATYTVTYNAGIGVTDVAVPTNQTKTRDVALTLSASVPTRTGYAFASWNTAADGSGTSYAAGASYTANAGVTLYAQWSNISDCDGQTFRTTVIGTQTWMAENLNCNVSGSECYNNQESNCSTYGRLYDWSTAMALPASCNSSTSTCSSQIGTKHKGICPSGWHIPSYAEWTTLKDFVGGSSVLKATSGWNDNGYGNGTDNYGFSALPGGVGNGSFYDVGYSGNWWSATESNASHAWYWYMSYHDTIVYSNDDVKTYLYSVRCVQD